MVSQPDKVAQKVDAIFRLLKARFNKDAGAELAHYSFTSLAAHSPHLKERAGVEKTLELIQKNTNGSISFKIKNERKWSRHSDMAEQSGVKSNSFEEARSVEIHVDDPKKLEKYENQVLKKSHGRTFSPNKIELIEIMPNKEDPKTILVINGQSDNPIKVSMGGILWGKFLEVAEEGRARGEKVRGVADYFNTNKKCPLYSQTTFDLTEILIAEDDQLYLAPGVKIKMKGPKTIARRRNKRT